MQSTLHRLLLALALITVTIAAQAAVDSTDLLIKALIEKKVITEDDASAIRADIAIIRTDEEAARRAYPITGKRPIRLSGYTQVRYVNAEGSTTYSSLEARRVRLALTGDPTPDIEYRVQVDFAGSRKAVTDTNFKTAQFGKPTLLDAVIGYRLPWEDKLNIGQQKVPFGLEQLTSSAFLDTINVSQVTEALTPGYDTGVLYAGLRPINDTQLVEYAAGAFNGTGINTGDDNEHKDLAARVVWRSTAPLLALGLDRYEGEAGTQKLTRDRTGVDLTYITGPWTFKGEHLWGTDADVKKRGWYVIAVRNFSPATQLVARYDTYDPNTAVADNASNTVTAGANWFLSPDGLSRIQVNYERKREEGTQVPNDQFLAQFQTGF